MKSLLPPELQKDWNVRDTVPRRNRMAELAFAGHRIPRCGLFKDMARLGVPLVIYDDEYAHCGEGKRLWKPDELVYDTYYNCFCSEYIGDPCARPARSSRELVVGTLSFHLVYQSRESWMSNVGGDFQVRTPPVAGLDRNRDLLPYPMYAVDFVDDDEDLAYTVDLNTCPGVPLEVVNLVGRDVLTESVAKFCKVRGLIA